MRRLDVVLSLAALLAVFAAPCAARAQVDECTGNDPEGARTEGDLGRERLLEAIREARAGGEERRGRSAREAIEHFDRQCAHGDPRGLSGRGAAFILLNEPLRSAQSYDAFLRARPLETLEPDERQRTEANLAPARARIVATGEPRGARLFIGGLDFGPLPRSTVVHLPEGRHRVEARGADGEILGEVTAALDASDEPTPVELEVRPARSSVERLSDWSIATGATALASLVLGVAFMLKFEERERAYATPICAGTPGPDCDPQPICESGLPEEGCEATRMERDVSLGIGVAGLVLTALATAGFVTLFVLDQQRPRDGARVMLRPEPAGASVALRVRF